jgi:uncharacterized RDD family membrane protein YckC
MTATALRPAHLGWRIAHTVVDTSAVILFVSIIAFIAGTPPDVAALPSLSEISREPIHSARRLVRLLPTAGTLLVLYWLVKLLYQIAFLGFCRGQTPGCWVFGLRVVQNDGHPVTWRHAFARTLIGGAMASIPVVGRVMRVADYAASLFGEKKRAIRDMAAGTILVHISFADG